MNSEQHDTIYPWQMEAWNFLQQNIQDQRLAHALLLRGSRGCGAEAFVSAFACAILCRQTQQGFACGSCQDCNLMKAGTHPDFLVLEPEINKEGKKSKVIKVDQVRRVVDFVAQTSMQGGHKVIVINPADAMNQNAANALLKCLEEPGAATQFLLISYQVSHVLPTIRSRCQRADLPVPTSQVADQWLSQYISDADARKNLLAMSANCPLDVLQWHEENTAEQLLEMRQQLSAVLTGETSPVVVAAQWVKQESAQIIQWWWRWLMVELKLFISQHESVLQQFGLKEKKLLAFMQKLLISKGRLESSANPNEQLLLESLLIDWQNLV